MKKLQAKVSVQKDNNKITVIASDETLDRHGEVLPIDQWDLSKFVKAPRMLVDHDHRVEKIVGRWSNPRIHDNKLLMDAEFHDFTDLAKAVQEMVSEGFLDTVSVGFIVNDPNDDGGRQSFELIETSWVTVPANHNARILKALEQVPSADSLEKIQTFAGETKAEELPKPADEQPEKKLDLIDSHEKALEWLGTSPQPELCLCSSEYILSLIAESQKHKTLTQAHEDLKKVVASEGKKNAKMLQLTMKEVAKQINNALQKYNQIYKK